MKKRRKARRTLGQAMMSGDIRFAGHVEVVGGYYHQMWDARMDGDLKEGAWLRLRRDPRNMHDSNAIQVFTIDGKFFVGFIAKEEAERLAPFMDIGVEVAARVLTYSNNPMRIKARLYIRKASR